MAKVQGTFYTAERLRRGTSPVSPPYLGEDGQPYPVNPPGSNPVFDSGVGIKLNGQVIGGVKRVIESDDRLIIPEFWQYNIHGLILDIDGIIENDGEINID